MLPLIEDCGKRLKSHNDWGIPSLRGTNHSDSSQLISDYITWRFSSNPTNWSSSKVPPVAFSIQLKPSRLPQFISINANHFRQTQRCAKQSSADYSVVLNYEKCKLKSSLTCHERRFYLSIRKRLRCPAAAQKHQNRFRSSRHKIFDSIQTVQSFFLCPCLPCVCLSRKFNFVSCVCRAWMLRTFHRTHSSIKQQIES